MEISPGRRNSQQLELARYVPGVEKANKRIAIMRQG